MGQPVAVALQLGVGRDPVPDLDGGVVRGGVDGVLEEVCDVQSHAGKTRTRSRFWLRSPCDQHKRRRHRRLPRRAGRPQAGRHDEPARGAQRPLRRDARDHVRGLGPGERRPGDPGLHPHRRRRLLLRGHGPQGGEREAAERELRVRRVRPDDHQVAAQGLPADQAADRGGRGPGDRRRHRDPAGHRHPGRRRVGQVRRRRGALVPLPDGRLRGPAAPPDPLHRRRRAAADRPARSWPPRPRSSA